MALTEHYHTKFHEGCFYHVYNRTVDKQSMFRSNDNYLFFLKKYDEYLSPVLNTYAYCLLGNHFHFLIGIQDLSTFKKLTNLPTDTPAHTIVSKQWKNFFQSYAMAFNKQHKRIGTLFQTPFKRALVDNSQYYTRLVYYIHRNPQHHKLVDNYKDWI
jgi:putative transposase